MLRKLLQQLRITMFIAAGVASSPVFAASVEVQALMADAALLKIDGQQHMLRNGQRSPEGVLLVSADPRHALVEIDGKRTSLTLSQRIAGSFAESDQTEVRIERNARQQYLTSAEINGRRTMVAVDTGANVVAISGDEARSMGIDYKKIGVPSQVTTASGVHSAYRVQLDKVVVGGIAINFVQATIIDGSFPETVLLGMTYLQHVGMREDNGVMYLRQKY